MASSVVVGDSHFAGTTVLKAEDDSELPVDANAESACQRSFELLKPVGRRHSEIVKDMGAVQGVQFAASDGPDITRDRPRFTRVHPVENVRRRLVREINDHRRILSSAR